MNANWESFLRWASYVDERGYRLVVPMLGSGFNAQAGVTVGWGDLMRLAQEAAGLTLDLPDNRGMVGNTTLVWEAMVLELALKRQSKPHQIEEKHLLPAVAGMLQRHYKPGGKTSAFARKFLGYRFTDIISFNFDEVLLPTAPRWMDLGETATGGRLNFDRVHGHALLERRGTRVWYPHGSVRDPASIQLGQRNYGTFINQLELARVEYKAQEKAIKRVLFPRLSGPSTDKQRHELWRQHRIEARNWLCVAMNAPLVFIGLGMRREEWPLWWFLNQRARNHARRAIERPVFVFMHRDEADRLRVAAKLARLTLLEFDDFQRGWSDLLAAFERPTRPFNG